MKTSKNSTKKANNVEVLVNSVNNSNEVVISSNESKEVVNLINNDDESLKNYIEALNKLNKLTYKDEGLKDSTKPKKSRINYNVPEEGTQSRKIYDYLKVHYKDEKFSIYKVCKVLNTPSNNTNRIYLKFFKELREEYLLNLSKIKEEEIDSVYENL